MSNTPGSGSTPAQMMPTRITLKPFSARNAASSSLKPTAAGVYGASLYTSLNPCRITTCPALLVNVMPVGVIARMPDGVTVSTAMPPVPD